MSSGVSADLPGQEVRVLRLDNVRDVLDQRNWGSLTVELGVDDLPEKNTALQKSDKFLQNLILHLNVSVH